jgi:hypothetical protein
MDESPTGCWTNHHSFIQFKNKWYLFYNHKDLSPQFDKNRSIRVDSLSFNADGTIRKVIPTLRGVGLTAASKNIQVDRYSYISEMGASITFLDTLDKFRGWKTTFDKSNGWIQYNSVDFGKKKLKTVTVRTMSKTGGTLQIRLNNAQGPVLASLQVPKSNAWKDVSIKLSAFRPGVQHLVVLSKANGNVEVDWVRFE